MCHRSAAEPGRGAGRTDTVAQAVLDRLERGANATFTADYEITPSLTVSRDARHGDAVGHPAAGDDRERRLLHRRQRQPHVRIGGTDCVDSIDDARASNLSVTSKFWGPSVSKLELDSARSVDASTGRTDTIANRLATCADVHVPSIDGVGSVTYCAVDDGCSPATSVPTSASS